MKFYRCMLGAALIVAGPLWAVAAPSRVVVPFDSAWKFHRGEVEGGSAPQFQDQDWQPVVLPHSWGGDDASSTGAIYQGPAWYRKQFSSEAAWKGRRVFVRFGAASLAAQVFLNGAKLGEHKGGFGAFCFELTSQLRPGDTNVLAVRVDNTRGGDISPLGGDFTIFGGLYRTASLIVTGQVNITPLDFASSGVYLKQANLTPAHAGMEVTVKVSNGSGTARKISAEVSVLDAAHKTVAKGRVKMLVPSGETVDLPQTIGVPNPHLWNGVADPYLYTARVELYDGRDKVDRIVESLGFREFHIDPARGAVLNGRVFQIHGTCRHQDGGDVLWAITPEQQDADMAIMREMGVNGVRLVHYQHNPYFYGLCDRKGVVAWAELALVNNVRGTPEFTANVRQQLQELIRQNFNHPSIVMWSMYNEIGSRNPVRPGPIVEDLNKLAHEEDSTRPTTGAASGDTIQNLPDVIRATDLVSVNAYPGWYSGKPSDMGGIIDKWNTFYGSKGISVSEYGAGASIHQHQQGLTAHPDAGGHFHPEEWQSICHEANYSAIQSRPFVWGSFLWVLFDFASAGRHEGDTDGINDKGLVTRDRSVKKDAFYYYKANWTAEPMVYITSRRHEVRDKQETPIKIYSNCQQVRVKLNGKDLGEVPKVAEGVFVLEGATLSENINTVEAEGRTGNVTVGDSCKWTYHPAASISSVP